MTHAGGEKKAKYRRIPAANARMGFISNKHSSGLPKYQQTGTELPTGSF
jgi:hypothetical protein